MTADTPAPRPIFLEELTPLVGKTLTADCDPRTVPLELVEASPLRNHAKLDREPFILIFRSAPDALLMSGSYVIRGEGFGPDVIDIAQIATPNTGTPGHYYQAVFN
ncbi:hypothetical protein ASE86_14625 [Sphingomonas sp. Leaf33]|uniref:DUF6916 family protein n=1 Tax=Sphingomonas sp. Leaf33 TaxID=1736215 RepID=UPI00070056C5|nr:hypothetical protein [Sphingomonas sp. Leaf33]KQN21206.1 hypothetical protein ASE86_14625 [Sphingomonas sp. Leaf33]